MEQIALNNATTVEAGQLAHDISLMRPYFDERGRAKVLIPQGYSWDANARRYVKNYVEVTLEEAKRLGFWHQVFNHTSLRKDEWRLLDDAVARAARSRLKAWQDLVNVGAFTGFDGLSKLVLEYESISDPGTAKLDFDALSTTSNDSPRFALRGLPLPIVHCDFWFSDRRLRVSRNSGTPLDTTLAEAAARRVAEMVEAMTIGLIDPSVTEYGTVTQGPSRHEEPVRVYGYINTPHRLTETFTAPTAANWRPSTTVNEILGALDVLYQNKFYGPFVIYHSTNWDKYLDADYWTGDGTGTAAVTQTLRQRIQQIEGITAVKRLDLLVGTGDSFTMVIVQATPDVARAVIGLDVTTVQWDERGGFEHHFKVMAIMVPQIFANFENKTGILHATT